jgi:hypothetical protein
VDRPAHERPLDDRAPLERAREVVAVEAFEARREADVRVGGVLVLDPAEALDRTRDANRRALDQELACEERPVQLTRGESAPS